MLMLTPSSWSLFTHTGLAQLAQITLWIFELLSAYYLRLAHEPSHSLVIDQKTQREQVVLHLQNAVCGMILMVLIHFLHQFQILLTFTFWQIVKT